MVNAIRTWRGPRPSPIELERRVRRELRIVRPEGYRLVGDPWGNRVRVDLAQVVEHIGLHASDARRWEVIPLIVPTIRRADRLYERGTAFTYEATHQIRHPVRGVIDRLVFAITDTRNGQRTFQTIVAPAKERFARQQRRRIGEIVATRRNPQRGGAGDTAAPGRERSRLAGPAFTTLQANDSAGERQASNEIWHLAGFVVGLLAIVWFARAGLEPQRAQAIS